MPNKYNPGDTAFIVESSRFIREVKILKETGDFATLHFADSDEGTSDGKAGFFQPKKLERPVYQRRQHHGPVDMTTAC